MKKWIYLYKLANDTIIYGKELESCSFIQAVVDAHEICDFNCRTLVGVIPYDMVVGETKCLVKVKK